jgi:hypothetical protein
VNLPRSFENHHARLAQPALRSFLIRRSSGPQPDLFLTAIDIKQRLHLTRRATTSGSTSVLTEGNGGAYCA